MAFKKQEQRERYFKSFKEASIEELEEACMDISEVVAVPIQSVWDDADNLAIPSRKAIYSRKHKDAQGKPQFVEVLSDEAVEIQASEVFTKVVREFKPLGIDSVRYRLDEPEDGKAVYLKVLFDRPITPADGEPIDVGFDMRTWNNGGGQMRIGTYMFRKVCSNGMMAESVFGSLTIAHRGSPEQIHAQIEDYFNTQMIGQDRFLELVAKAYDTPITVEQAHMLTEHMGDRMQKAIITMYMQRPLEQRTKWNLYNDATNYSSEARWSANTEVNYLNQCFEIINPSGKKKTKLMAGVDRVGSE